MERRQPAAIDHGARNTSYNRCGRARGGCSRRLLKIAHLDRKTCSSRFLHYDSCTAETVKSNHAIRPKPMLATIKVGISTEVSPFTARAGIARRGMWSCEQCCDRDASRPLRSRARTGKQGQEVEKKRSTGDSFFPACEASVKSPTCGHPTGTRSEKDNRSRFRRRELWANCPPSIKTTLMHSPLACRTTLAMPAESDPQRPRTIKRGQRAPASFWLRFPQFQPRTHTSHRLP
jgi:hypothetical protein